MCGGLSAKFGQQPPDGSSGSGRRRRQHPPPRGQRAIQNGNITVGCVGKDTVYTLHDLAHGGDYYVTVFGQYQNKSVSFQYGTAKFRYEDPSASTSLLIRHQRRKYEFRLTPARPYKRLELRGPSKRESPHFFLVPCGGQVRLRVISSFRDNNLPREWKRIVSGKLILSHINTNSSTPATADHRYHFELQLLEGAPSVEFQATWRRRRLKVAKVTEKLRVRTAGPRRRAKLGLGCTQMALRMRRATGHRDLEYCVLLEPDTTGRRQRRFKQPSACGLERRLEHSPANLTRCGTSKQLRKGKRVEVIFDEMTPGQSYVARAMVRPLLKKGQIGRFVPYRVSQVTLPPCSEELPNELTESTAGGLEPISASRSGGLQGSEQGDRQLPGTGQSAEEARVEAAEEAYNELNDWTQ